MAKKKRVPRIYLKIDYGNSVRIGPGKVQLLKLIREEHSISAAARAMGLSYRRAWLLVEETNNIFGKPVVSTRIGGKGHGGATLTALGESIISTYETIMAKIEAVTEAELQALAVDEPDCAKAAPASAERV